MNLTKIDIAVLCGGLGTRLRSTIGERQKTMAEVDGRPFLDIQLEYFSAQGFRRVILLTGYQAEDIAARYAKGMFGMEILCSHEREPLGTGGAIKNARALILSDPFVALNGDCFCELNYADLIEAHAARRADMTLTVVRVDEAKDFGSIFINPDGRIREFREKAHGVAASPFISAGIYCLNQEVFSWMPAAQKFMVEKDLFPTNVHRRIYSFETTGKFLDIGTPDRFQQAQELVKKARETRAQHK